MLALQSCSSCVLPGSVHFSSHRFRFVLILNLGFLIWVFPTMYISQRLRLGKYLGANIVLWGIIMMLHSVPQSFGPFFVLRLLLGKRLNSTRYCSETYVTSGMLESCVAPILILIISMFYTKREQVSLLISPGTTY